MTTERGEPPQGDPSVATPSNVVPLRWGARPEDWHVLGTQHGLRDDLLPVVSNPRARIAPTSKLSALGKVPSRYNGDGLVIGFAKWTERTTTDAEVAAWSKQSDYGICVQTRRLPALDIDVEDEDLVGLILSLVAESAGGRLYERRWRANSSKCLIPVRCSAALTKRRLVLPNGAGAVELLASGQQFVAVGTHPSGHRYQWGQGLDAPQGAFLELDEEELEALWLRLRDRLDADDSRSGPERPRAEQMTEAVSADPVAAWLFEHGMVKSVGREGQLYVDCPNTGEHTTESSETSTCYYPAHTGGFQQGHWKCLHAHCQGKPDSFFTQKLDMIEFEDLSGDQDDPDELAPRGDDADGSAAGDSPVTDRTDRFKPVPLAAYLTRMQNTRWRVKEVLPAEGVGTVYGPSSAAKSFSVIDMLFHIALGRDWQGQRVFQGRVVYLAAEGQGGMPRRLAAWCRHHEVDPSAVEFDVIDAVPNLLERADLKAIAKHLGPCAVLVIDTAMAVTAGADENSSEDMGKLLRHAALLAKHIGGLVLLVHHAGKDLTRGQRGWSGLKGAIDVEIEVSRIDENGELRQMKLSKVRDGRKEGHTWTFRLEDVNLGVDEDGDPLGSAVPVYVEPPAPVDRGPRLGKNEALVWRAVHDAIAAGDDATVGEILAVAASRMAHDPQKRDTRRQHARQALQSLLDRELVEIENDRIRLP